jgi:K+-sensing histidine kinase KdpD
MVSNLLYVHKDEVAESKPCIAIQDLVDIVASCLQELEPFFVERNLTASIKIADDCNFVYCDSFCLHRVLINLLHNACTHARYGSEIVLSADLDSDNALVLQVIDDGDGVDPELLPTLFERVTPPRSATRKPSGLGLYVAGRIVESAGGSIACISAPFAGATFRVRLPNKKP